MDDSGKIDVMYPLSAMSRWDNNELRYSLRSMEKFLPNLGRVFVVGFKPPWLTNAIHIPAVDCYTRNKDANLIMHVLVACASGISERFLRASDDQCLLRTATMADLVPRHCGHPRKIGKSGWWQRFSATCKVLTSAKLPSLFYECHVPMLYWRDDFVRTVTQFPFAEGNGYTINSLYFNASRLKHGARPISRDRTGVGKNATADELCALFATKLYVNYNDGCLTPALKEALARTFPEMSRFELSPLTEPERHRVSARPAPVRAVAKKVPRVWTYWEGPKPPWIALCLRTMEKNIPGIEILDPQSWKTLYYEYGGDPQVWAIMENKAPNLKSDFIRAWLLHTIGGIWTDADAIFFRDIRPIWTAVENGSECVTYNWPEFAERRFEWSAILAADTNSRIIASYLEAIIERIKKPDPLRFSSIGPRMLRWAAKHHWKAPVSLIPFNLVHPYWSTKTRTMLEPRSDPRNSPPDAYCVMLTHRALGRQRWLSEKQLLEGRGCVSKLFRRALGDPQTAPPK